MLTKETAIARLRATGTLGGDQSNAFIIPAAAAKEPLCRVVSKLVTSNIGTRAARMVAPACNQSVLP